jgi:CheY-like chemotaxis protein
MTTISDLQGKRIFITEDDSMNRVVYMMLLGACGAILEFDRWGNKTPQILKGFKPDLIILDLMLPQNKSGFDVFNDIQQRSEHNDVPIVAVSASEPSFALPQCKQMGFAGFIAKPIEEELFVDQVIQLINGEQVWYVGERYGGSTYE